MVVWRALARLAYEAWWAIPLFAVVVLAITYLVAGLNLKRECTGYVRTEPIYRPNVDGVMVREERFRCDEWK